ncbi:predicted protein [Nematostella vectensis]|uniref:Globin domain-containing protein n=1 Tax=Nematostella vectensis TaxID=45351 RepID=A7RHV8_NEMVE|nr:predicted protein [Nematostella vectensis]|eukprot:XP_001640985.1 predicted protein [Nematostella vectensis]
MGCGSSTFKPPREPVKIPLSVAQKYLVRETWETIEQHSKAVGKKTFLRMFYMSSIDFIYSVVMESKGSKDIRVLGLELAFDDVKNSYRTWRFFEMNPDYQKLFPEFATLDQVELEQANALHGHAKRVMKAVENAVSAMDDAESFAAYLENLGARHKARALKPAYLDAMQVAYTDTIQDLLKTQWTDGTAEAWNKLFRFIADTMKHGLSS